MTKVRVRFNKVRDACYQAFHDNNKSKLLNLLRSGYQLTLDDQKVMADFIEGKIKPKRGRKVDLDQHAALTRYAAEVARLKLNHKKSGLRISHRDAIDAVVTPLFPPHLRTAAANKLDNFIRRSKQRKKAAR